MKINRHHTCLELEESLGHLELEGKAGFYRTAAAVDWGQAAVRVP